MDMAKRVAFGTKEWAEYVEFQIRSGLSIEEGFTLALLEMEVPFARLGFETFSEFLEAQIPNLEVLLKDSDLSQERSLIPIESTGDLKIGSRVIWFGKDSTTFKGTVQWLGSIERILCAGVFTDQKIGSPFPIMWRGKRLFYTPTGHSLVLRVNELILKSDYAQRQTSMISRALTKLMRKVTIRERPRENHHEGDSGDGEANKVRQFDVIYPYAVAAGPTGLKVNDAVLWANNSGSFRGVIKWLGHLNCKSGLTVGIDFKSDVGNCSGEYEGHKLFDCEPNQGKFLCIESIRKSDLQFTAIQQNSLISSHTFEFTNQDLSSQWERNQRLPRQFQLGDFVLYQRDSNSYHTGTLEWLGTNEQAEVAGIKFDAPIRNRARLHPEPLPFECPSERGDIVPMEKIVPYIRPATVEERILPPVGFRPSPEQIQALRSRASHEWFPHKGVIAPAISADGLKRLIGYRKGVQGHANSSHMDSVLFAIFSCSDTFDSFLLQTDDDDSLPLQILKEILRTEVANRLRKRFYCHAANVQAVAHVFSKGDKRLLPGKPDQVLQALLENVNPVKKKNPFLHYKDGSFSYVHRIMATTSNISENIVTIQRLLETDLKLKSLQLVEDPSPALVVVLPERNEELAPSKIFIPNFILNLNNLMMTTSGGSSPRASPTESPTPCTLCGENSSTECPDCDDSLVSTPTSSGSTSSNTFCDQCSEAFHQHWARRGHRQSVIGSGGPGKLLELQSIICSRDNQSIAFVKCGKGKSGEWIVHDSVPDGSSPQVQNVFSLTDCFLSLENEPSTITRDWDSFIPEVKIILSHAHMCIYSSVESSPSGGVGVTP